MHISYLFILCHLPIGYKSRDVGFLNDIYKTCGAFKEMYVK